MTFALVALPSARRFRLLGKWADPVAAWGAYHSAEGPVMLCRVEDGTLFDFMFLAAKAVKR